MVGIEAIIYAIAGRFKDTSKHLLLVIALFRFGITG